MADTDNEDLVLYKAPMWSWLGYLLIIGGGSLFMYGGSYSNWPLLGGGLVGCVLGGIVLWAKLKHQRAWSRRNNVPV